MPGTSYPFPSGWPVIRSAYWLHPHPRPPVPSQRRDNGQCLPTPATEGPIPNDGPLGLAPHSGLLLLSATPCSLSIYRARKFITGHIYQIRAQKSCQAAHPSWFNPSDCRTCTLCDAERETFSHTILLSPAKAAARARHLQGLSTVDINYPLWASVFLSLVAYLKSTGTAFPPNMIPSSLSFSAFMVFPSYLVGYPQVILLAST